MTRTQNHTTSEYRGIPDLTETERHRLLTSERRQRLLPILSNQTPPMDIDTVTEKIVQRDAELETADNELHERVKTKLHHTHLPMMSDMGILEYDSEGNRIDFAESRYY